MQIGEYCAKAGISVNSTNGTLNIPQGLKEIQNGVIYELEKFRRNQDLPGQKAMDWTEVLFGKTSNKIQTLASSWDRIYKKVTKFKKNSNKKGLHQFLEKPYNVPQNAQGPITLPGQLAQTTQRMLHPHTSCTPHAHPPAISGIDKVASYVGNIVGSALNQVSSVLYHKDEEILSLKQVLDRKEQKFEEEMRKKDAELQQLEEEVREKNAELQHVEKEVRKKNALLVTYTPRNVTRRENTKIKQLQMEKDKVNELREEMKIVNDDNKNLNTQLTEMQHELHLREGQIEELKLDIEIEEDKKINAQKRASKWKIKCKTDASTSSEPILITDLKEKVEMLEDENMQLKEEIETFCSQRSYETFGSGRYSDAIREVYYRLLSENVSVSKIESVVRTVLESAGMEVKRLPKKSAAARMLKECHILTKIQVGTKLLSCENNTLQLDGTTKKFKEYGTFNFTTGDGEKLSAGIEDLPSGHATSYMNATKNILQECASLLFPGHEEHELNTTLGKMMNNIKNIATDRHVVNKTYMEQLKIYRAQFLPLCHENFNQLDAKQLENLLRINHLFCGLHAVHNVAMACKESVKDFEAISGKAPYVSRFSNSSTFDLLWATSKALTLQHDYQKAGVVQQWKDFMETKQENEYLVSLRGERFNTVLVAAGALYYHIQKGHLASFFDQCTISNKLTQCITNNIGVKIHIAALRSLGIMAKLVTSPLFRILEGDGHIFSLNHTWETICKRLEDFSMDAKPLLEEVNIVPGATINKDAVYHELFCDTGDDELDVLTLDCLRLLSCSSCILLTRQLEDQLPGGKYHLPSDDIMSETAKAPLHNMLTERDFAHLDRKLRESPNMSTVALSGKICFTNNKSSQWLKNLDDATREQYIKTARQEGRKSNKMKNDEMRKMRRQEVEKKQQKKENMLMRKENKKEELDKELMNIGGLWRTTTEMNNSMMKMGEKEKKAALQTQIRYRKQVLSTKVDDKKLLQLSSGTEEYSTTVLQENLQQVLKYLEASTSAANSTTENVQSIRPSEERRNLVDGIVARKRKNDGNGESAPTAKSKKTDKYPDLVGCTVLQKWEDSGEDKWMRGQVIKVVTKGQNKGDWVFEVKYEDDDQTYDVELYQDFDNGDLVLI